MRREVVCKYPRNGHYMYTRVAACMVEETAQKDTGSIHNNKRHISDDQRNKMDDHLFVSRYAGHGGAGGGVVVAVRVAVW